MGKIKKYIYRRINRYGVMQFYFCDTPLTEAGLKRIPNRMWIDRNYVDAHIKQHNYDPKGLPDPKTEAWLKRYKIV